MASKEIEGPQLRVYISKTGEHESVERPTSAPSERKKETPSHKKLQAAYRYSRLSIRKRAKYLLRKHHKRMTKDHKEQKKATEAAAAVASVHTFSQTLQLKNEGKSQELTYARASSAASPRPRLSPRPTTSPKTKGKNRRSYTLRGRARQLRNQAKRQPPLFGNGKISPLFSIHNTVLTSTSSAAAVAPINSTAYDFDDSSSCDSHS